MTARDRVARELRHRILLGALKEGDRIDLDGLAGELGTSRTPIREACLELANDGLLRMAPRSGISVIGITEADLLDNFDLMAVLAGMAAMWAALRADPSDLKRIRGLRDAVAEASRAGGDVAMVNFEFHRCINQTSRSPRVMSLIGQTAKLFPERFSDVVPAQVQCSLREHAEVVDAIADRDGERARMVMEGHFKAAADRLREHLASPAIER